jgi:hypothetical protein
MPERVFQVDSVRTAFDTALRGAKLRLEEDKKKEAAKALDGFRFHDLRHTAASWLAMGGASLAAIQKFLGHSSIKMTLRYAHLSPDFLGEEARILDRMLPSAVPNLRHPASTKSSKQKQQKASSSKAQSVDRRQDKQREARRNT